MATTYTPFEKQLLACYWALVETECLTDKGPVTLSLILPFGGESTWTEWPPRWEGLSKPCLSNGNDIFKNAAVLAPVASWLYMKSGSYLPERLSFAFSFLWLFCLKQNCWLNGALSSGFPLNAWAWFTNGLATLKPVSSQSLCDCSTSLLTCRTQSGYGHYTQRAEFKATLLSLTTSPLNEPCYICTYSWAIASGLALWSALGKLQTCRLKTPHLEMWSVQTNHSCWPSHLGVSCRCPW